MTNKQFVKSERQFIIELLKKLNSKQWQAKTLCEGWRVEDLAAHLVTRERNAIGGIGLVVPGLHGLHDKRIAKVAAHGHGYIIDKLQKYPWYMPAALNTGEFWVHNEDFLRGELHITRPVPSKEANAILWGSLGGLVGIKKDLVKDLGNVTFKNIETGEKLYIKNKNSIKKTILLGTAGELLLFFYGRRDAADVKVS